MAFVCIGSWGEVSNWKTWCLWDAAFINKAWWSLLRGIDGSVMLLTLVCFVFHVWITCCLYSVWQFRVYHFISFDHCNSWVGQAVAVFLLSVRSAQKDWVASPGSCSLGGNLDLVWWFESPELWAALKVTAQSCRLLGFFQKNPSYVVADTFSFALYHDVFEYSLDL